MNKVAVAVGIIERSNGDILIAKRHQHLHQGGKWEFPGGKIEQGETTYAALARELKEEVDITVNQAQQVLLLEHDYGDKVVVLDIWLVDDFEGIGHSNEGQQIKWVAKGDLASYQFPDANRPILHMITQG